MYASTSKGRDLRNEHRGLGARIHETRDNTR